MAGDEWFEVDDELDDIQSAFVSVLRARAATWPLKPNDAELLLPHFSAYGQMLAPGESAEGRLLIVVDVSDDEMNLILLTVGAYLNRDQLTGDVLHNQLYTLPDRPSPLGLQAQGDPVTLGHLASDWLEKLLARAIMREEWVRSGEVYAWRWVLAGIGPIVEGRERTGGLGPPDRVIAIRGEPNRTN
jgi:hypothetical protein